MNLLGLKTGDAIILVIDKKELYVTKVNGNTGFVISAKKSGSGYGTNSFNCKKLVTRVMTELEIDCTSVVIKVATQPTTIDGIQYYALLHSTKITTP
jgi:hypothetical protein